MDTIRTLIVDDEPLARDTLRLLLEDQNDFTLIGEAADGPQALDTLRETRPDLVFLDIQMPGLSGLEVVRQLEPAELPVVIFVTAYDQYAVDAFETHALDYLIKPFDDDRFERTLARARQRFEEQRLGALSERLLSFLKTGEAPTPTPSYTERLVVKNRDSVYFVKVDDVAWIEAAGDYVILHAHGKRHLIRETMTGMVKQLDPQQFARIHRSSIVNLGFVRELKPYFHGDYKVYLQDGTELRLSRRYWPKVSDRFGG